MSATTFDSAWDLTPADRLLIGAKRWAGLFNADEWR